MCFEKGDNRFVSPGYNYRLTDIQASLINSQLQRLDSIINFKQGVAKIYSELLDSDLLVLPKEISDKKQVWQTYHVVVPEYIDRNKLIDKLKSKGISTNYGAQCIPDLGMKYK